MKRSVAVLCLYGAILMSATLTSTASRAVTADDVRWINQCVADSRGLGASANVVLNYCTCMVNKMDDNETQSVTQWEKTHVAERRACASAAGWN